MVDEDRDDAGSRDDVIKVVVIKAWGGCGSHSSWENITNNAAEYYGDIEVEVDTHQQLDDALETKATSILLDNFSPESLPKTIKHIRSHKNSSNIYIELSGGIHSDNIDAYCIKGVDGISIGALTSFLTGFKAVRSRIETKQKDEVT